MSNTENTKTAAASDLSVSAGYALFAGHCYYPEGGSEDFRGFGTVEELKKLYAENADKWSRDTGSYEDPWGQIAERGTMKTMLCTRGHGKWQKTENVF